MLEQIHLVATTFSRLAWGPWLLVLLLGGGVFFLIYSRFLPFRYLPHSWALLRGRLDDESDPGDITHFQALSTALAGTIGTGNIGGVALAIYLGGPGAIFWMWMTAIVGIATKFFTCTLAVMYRGKDARGHLQGGPMYVIREALSPRMRFLAYMFAVFGMIGSLPAFQTNQLIQILRDVIVIPAGYLSVDDDPFGFNIGAGIVLAVLTALVVTGGLQRVAAVAVRLVPFMSVIYLAAAGAAILMNITEVPAVFALIVTDAFTGSAAGGGAVGAIIIIGVQRGAFSNEAGIGTEALAHGAAKTKEPVREGLVAMTGPIIDTLLICTATAMLILISGVWQTSEANGVTLTAQAFDAVLGTPGLVIVFTCVICFATTTIFTYSKCFNFIFHPDRENIYRVIYIGFILVAAVIGIEAAVSIIDGAFALMAIPTMISTLILAPKVIEAARRYFASLQQTDPAIS